MSDAPHRADLARAWDALPTGARVAFEEQWAGVGAGALPCGSAIVDAQGRIVASGRNYAYDAAGAIETRVRYPLQHNRLAHAELNALACLPT
jgi:tRNA(Arg) A34 adenosine deaminase TadA